MKLTSARISQLLFLTVFCGLFIFTDYRGKDEISVAVNSFFRADPLVALSYLIATKSFTYLLIPGALMFLFSIALGRFFCGWVCPLGAIIDLVTHLIKKTVPLKFLKTSLKYYLLVTLLFTALFNINLSGILDPMAILVRALTFFLYPLFGYTVRSGWVGLYALLGDRRDSIEPFYNFLKAYILPFRETFYPLALVSFLLFLFVLFLERFEERNWCKNLCPLGALLGILTRFSPARRVPGRLCADCGECKNICPTGFDREVLQKSDCILCMECQLKCNLRRVRFKFGRIRHEGGAQKNEKLPVLERRVFIGGLLSGFFLSRIFAFQSATQSERLLRPPGVLNEGDFQKRCVRCGECMKVCLRSALYPDYFRAGLYGLFMPVMVPRLGYCEYNCNLCGQVCPTGAIPNLPPDRKKKSVVGLAVIDKNHCLPYAKKMNCIVCEEHCPIPEKAIRTEVVQDRDYQGNKIDLKRPYIVDELCIGCGICENKCPLEGKPAIEVFAKKNRS
ncbi:MAG TPA: 4Fe-4S binding protein [Syntrophorhabdaceae bacterium]|nr:4Fe-4S binding protein [Syntrophorhabdaceae bacterium]